MKKKLLTLLLAFTMLFTNSAIAFAAEPLEKEPTEMQGAIPEVTGAQALAAIGDENSVVIDIRATADYNKNHIKGTINLPVCKADFSVTTDERDNFVDYAQKNIGTDKKVYLICYVGTFCVNYASKWLVDAGYDADNLYRVNGGVWNNEDLAAACNSVHYDQIPADGLILDVRATEVYYENGYVDGSLHQPLFYRVDGSNKVADWQNKDDELVKAFNAFVDANKSLLESSKIYILCNGGASGANAATNLLREKGFTVAGQNIAVFTIENGARSDISKSFVFNQFVDGKDAVAKVDDDSVVILDVRAPERRTENGYLKGSISMPLFTANGDKNVVTSGYDTLAMNFLQSVADNADKLNGKDIYILCNGGASGAKAATKLLMQAGYSTKDVYTITGGANNEDVKAAFIKDTEYNFVAGNAARTADPSKVFIIDVRTEANYNKGHLTNSVNWPLFDANGVSNATDDALAQAFNANLAANADTLAGKDIYIVCNSGARGAQAGTKLLIAAGYSNDNIFTITNGAKGLDVRYGFLENAGKLGTPVEGSEAVAAVGNSNIVILDVRASGNFGSGHLKGAVSQPLFSSTGVAQTADDELAKAFTEYVTANKESLAGKEIYIMCNSGQSGARAATVLLQAAGIAPEKIHTITGGAKGEDVAKASIYVSDTRAINALKDDKYLVIDVRSAEKYEDGHLDGSLSLPLFDKDNNLPDDLAAEFTAYVKEHKAELAGKTIYILCNSGSRGAEKAIKLLAEEGITSVFIIEGGAKSTVIQSHFVTDDGSSTETKPGTGSSSTGPKTGDNAPIMLYTMILAASLAAILAVSKKKFTK